MNLDILIATVSALASITGLGAAALSRELVEPLLRRVFGRPRQDEKPYAERLAKLSSSLTRASQEVDSVLRELAQVAGHRETAVRKLETDLASLQNREKDLKERIELLEKTPIPVAEHFAKLLESGERRSARRDYLLFGAGVLVTTSITIAIQLLRR